MHLPEEYRAWLLNLLQGLFLQFAPLVVIFLFPLAALSCTTTAQRISSRVLTAAMVLESLTFSLPWNWGNGQSNAGPAHGSKKLRKKHVGSGVAPLEMNGHARPETRTLPSEGYYPGLINISGTYCFMNSTLQAMASLSYLNTYLNDVHEKAIQLAIESPVVDALLNLINDLNSPRPSYHSIRPSEIVGALSRHSRGGRSSLFYTGEHQDAQELFQLISECIKKEVKAVYAEGLRDRGLVGLPRGDVEGEKELQRNVFDGLTANRRSCVDCGYTEAVMHFAFDSWQLAIPRHTAPCQLEQCLAEYTKIESLTDCICRRCSFTATHQRLQRDAEQLEKITSDPQCPRPSKKRAKETRKLEQEVRMALDHGRLEEDIRGLTLQKVFSKASTKQAMIARPPPVLVLHLNRSLSYGQFAVKNNIRVIFPEILDLTPYTTSGNLSIVPSAPISPAPPNLSRSRTPTQATYSSPRTFYRLSAVVCHYGQHSFGHYICFRRKPRPPSCAKSRFPPPRFADPIGCDCEKCLRYGNIRDDDEAIDSMYRPGHGWLRISDDLVSEVGIETVLQEGSGAFMLYYERVVQPRPSIYPLHDSPCSSEETLKAKPSTSTEVDGSTASLTNAFFIEKRENTTNGARVVRSVLTRRERSMSPRHSSKEQTPIPNGLAVTPPTEGARYPTRSSQVSSRVASGVPRSPGLPASAPKLYHHHSTSTSSSHSPLVSLSHRSKRSAVRLTS